MSDDLVYAPSPRRLEVACRATSREELAELLCRRWDYVRLPIHAPLSAAPGHTDAMRLAETTGKCLRSVARLRHEPADQQELWDFTQYLLKGLEDEGWDLRVGIHEDSVLALVCSSTPGAPEVVAVDVPFFGGSHGAEIATDWVDALNTLYWARNVANKVRRDMEAEG